MPSAAPTNSPSIAPTRVPSDAPSIASITSPSYDRFIVSDDNGAAGYEFVEVSDIKFKYIRSVSSYYDDSRKQYIYNPGYRNRFESSVEINLNTQSKINLFETWLFGNKSDPNDQVNVTVQMEWLIYDITDDTHRLISLEGEKDVGITSYSADLYQVTGNSSATYTIYSYYTIYSDSLTGINENSKYSGVSVCNSYDDSYFTGGNTYKW